MSRYLSALVGIAAAVSAVACGNSGSAPVSDAPAPQPASARIELPESVAYPEGIAHDAATGSLYTASAENGTVVRVNAATGAAEVLVPAGTLVPEGNTTFPGPLGMSVDASNRLWIAGGFTGKAWVVNTADGSVIKEVTVPTAPKSLINDVAIVGSAGYFTDTFVPTLWRVSETNGTFGDVEPWLDLTGTPIAYGDGPNLNGIAATPDGQTLIVVHMGKGQLFKIDVATKAVTPIETGGADLTTADGLVLDGDRLFVIRQGAQEVVTLQLNADRTAATEQARVSDGLTWPATAALVGDELIVVNTQFNARDTNTAQRPFALLRVPVR
jgi:sugar lactone lactonase YvrE